MIRIKIDGGDLEALIRAEDSNWLSRAGVRTSEYRTNKCYTGGSEFWGDIKGVYITLQNEKCAFCETKLAGRELASKVHEVEHFRPKNRVSAWPGKLPKGAQPFDLVCKVGGASSKGYYLLAYHPFNYSIACTRCNSTLKSDYFPVRGGRNCRLSDPVASREDALLIYPLGDIDSDPRKIIKFDGVLAVPVNKSGRKYERARVTIDLFQLNHQDLTTRRAKVIFGLWLNLDAVSSPGASAKQKANNQHAIDLAVSESSEFSACAADFVALFHANRAAADDHGENAKTLAMPNS